MNGISSVICLIITFASALTSWVAQAAGAESVKIVVPFAAGGANDLLTRTFASALSKPEGQAFYVENRSGGAGLIGTEAVARAPADGLTLLGSGMGALVVSPMLSKAPPYDPMVDFTQIAMFGGTPHILVVHPSLHVTNFAELVTAARAANNLDYVSASYGSPGNLVGEMLSRAVKIPLTHIAYRGAGQSVTDLVAGHVKVGIISYSTALPFLEAGTLVPLAISTANRMPELPNTPTLKELGLDELVTLSWYGLAGPAGLSRDLVEELNTAVGAAFDNVNVKKVFREQSIVPMRLNVPETSAFVKAEITKWKPFIDRMRN